MAKKVKCLNCGKAFSFLTLAGSWPGRIKCTKCKNQHKYKNVWFIAIIFYAIFIAGIPFLSYLSELVAIEENGIYDKGILSNIVYFGGFLSLGYILGSLYIYFIRKLSSLQLKDT